MQILLHDLQTVESFAPTLVDGRFVVQISLSVAASLIANILLQTVFATILGALVCRARIRQSCGAPILGAISP